MGLLHVYQPLALDDVGSRADEFLLVHLVFHILGAIDQQCLDRHETGEASHDMSSKPPDHCYTARYERRGHAGSRVVAVEIVWCFSVFIDQWRLTVCCKSFLDSGILTGGRKDRNARGNDIWFDTATTTRPMGAEICDVSGIFRRPIFIVLI